ncbi:MAG: hypothetical protein BWY82_02240 [Verrucomicrobia bacterium ADurb.Bin474]|nr:MAG: hypothetical protein BWY82_02240 [Verrucomicrobia bacterium ADurb.Bin474]
MRSIFGRLQLFGLGLIFTMVADGQYGVSLCEGGDDVRGVSVWELVDQGEEIG